MAKRRCKGKTRAGKRCRAAPLKGGDHCGAHDPNRPDETRFGSAQQASRAGASEKPRTPKLSAALASRVEEEADAILAPYFKALGVTYDNGERVLGRGAVVVGKTKDGDVIPSDVEDLGAQIIAAERLLNRVFGRPKQATEISGPDGGPVAIHDERLDLSRLSDDQLDQLERLVRDATPDA